MSEPRLRFSAVVKQYDAGAETIRAVDGVSLTVAAGETVLLWGPSGSGKSTILRLAAAIARPDEGVIEVDGAPTPAARDSRAHGWRWFSVGKARTAEALYRRRRIGYITQDPNLMPAATAVENAGIKLRLDGERRRDARDRATRLLEDVGLGDRLGHLPAQLSGGELQRVAIAQAVLNEPSLLLADEPTAHLDSATARDVFVLLAEQAKRCGAGLILVSHDKHAMQVADRVLHLRDGRLHEGD